MRTTHQVSFFTDNAGVVAFDLPELMGVETWLNLEADSYEARADGFGMRGVRFTPEPGGDLEVKVSRKIAAKRLGRITGGGLFGESGKLGRRDRMEGERVPRVRQRAECGASWPDALGLGRSVLAEMRKLRGLGIRTVYGVCDRIDDEIVRATDATTIVTEFLRQQHASELRERIHIVHDGIERPDICHPHDSDAGSKPASRLRAVLVTSSTLETIPVIGRLPRHLDLTVVGRYPESPSLKQAIRGHLKRALLQPSQPGLGTLRSAGFQTSAWHPERVYADLVDTDIGIIPVDTRFDPLPGREVSYWEVKSENRLTLKMALGLPVIASPVPAYLDIVEQGVNGYIARTRAEWLHAIDALRSPEHRRQIGLAARRTVLERFSMNRNWRVDQRGRAGAVVVPAGRAGEVLRPVSSK